MLHPSYTDLMKVVNKDVEEGDTKIVNSRYSIVMATAKRARQLIAGDLPLVDAKDAQVVSAFFAIATAYNPGVCLLASPVIARLIRQI